MKLLAKFIMKSFVRLLPLSIHFQWRKLRREHDIFFTSSTMEASSSSVERTRGSVLMESCQFLIQVITSNNVSVPIYIVYIHIQQIQCYHCYQYGTTSTAVVKLRPPCGPPGGPPSGLPGGPPRGLQFELHYFNKMKIHLEFEIGCDIKKVITKIYENYV